MEPDPRDLTGDLGYDTAHEVTGPHQPQAVTPRASGAHGQEHGTGEHGTGDHGTGDHGYDEAHDFRR